MTGEQAMVECVLAGYMFVKGDGWVDVLNENRVLFAWSRSRVGSYVFVDRNMQPDGPTDSVIDLAIDHYKRQTRRVR